MSKKGRSSRKFVEEVSAGQAPPAEALPASDEAVPSGVPVVPAAPSPMKPWSVVVRFADGSGVLVQQFDDRPTAENHALRTRNDRRGFLVADEKWRPAQAVVVSTEDFWKAVEGLVR